MNPWLAAILGAGAVYGGLRFTENRLLFPRTRTLKHRPEDEGLEAEDVEFYAADGVALHAWWFEREDAIANFIMCHGNAGNLASRLWVPRDLADIPLNVLLFDYRGYGRSKGFPTEKGIGKDVVAAHQLVQAKAGNLPTIVYGRSLGGAVALQLCEQREVAGVILESTFTSVMEMGNRFYPWLLPRFTCGNPYYSIDRLRKVQTPVLIAHSPDDEVVPYDMGQALSEAAPNLWKFCRLSGLHDDAGWQDTHEYAQAVRQYIRERSSTGP